MNEPIFFRTLDEWEAKVTGGLDALARVSIQDLGEAVIDDTPVDTAFLVSSWQPALGAPILTPETPSKGGKHGDKSAANAKLGLVIVKLELGQALFYTNNAVYAKRIEWGFVGEDSLGRTYNQAGRFMVTKNIERWENIVEGAVMKLGLAA